MDVPNIYKNASYRSLIVIPVIVMILALAVIYFNGIPAGIDLRGGILITLQANSTVDAELVKQSLTDNLGVHDVTVNTGASPFGTSVEVELEQNENLAAAEKALREYYEAYDTYSKADFGATSARLGLEDENSTIDKSLLQRQLDEFEAMKAESEATMEEQEQIVFSATEPLTGRVDKSNATDYQSTGDLLSDTYSQAREVYKQRVISVLQQNMEFDEYAYKEVGPSLSEFFLDKTIQVVIISLLLTTFVVVVVFRSFVPSVAVMFGALSDIIFALGAMSLLGIPLTLASFGALLMLIGYSLDTDILLTIRIMKREEGTPRDRAYGAMKTGLTMSATSIVAFSALFLLSILTQLPTYFQISAVVICGLIGDMIATWFTNAVMVLWHVETKKR